MLVEDRGVVEPQRPDRRVACVPVAWQQRASDRRLVAGLNGLDWATGDAERGRCHRAAYVVRPRSCSLI